MQHDIEIKLWQCKKLPFNKVDTLLSTYQLMLGENLKYKELMTQSPAHTRGEQKLGYWT